jgi:hypothetical protein
VDLSITNGVLSSRAKPLKSGVFQIFGPGSVTMPDDSDKKTDRKFATSRSLQQDPFRAAQPAPPIILREGADEKYLGTASSYAISNSLLKNSISPQSDSVTDSFGFRFVHAFDARRRSFSADC